jgi:hypothetical protein
LLVGMMLFEEGEALQLGIRFGERQHRRVARRDGFHLGVGKLLAADILGLAHGAVAGHDLVDEPGGRVPEPCG